MKTATIIAAVALAALTLSLATNAHAWGDTAHKIICEIAFQEFTDSTRAEVIRLIKLDPDFRFFNESCTWPDHPRKRASEHFVNVPRNFGTFTAATCPVADRCLLTAITHDIEVLKTSTDDAAKLAALKFLGHWVGDIHQPLHVSFEDDRGGNKINERGPCRNSLHSVWDTCMVEREMGTDVLTIGRELLNEVTDAERTAWQSKPVFEWANESLAIARQASVGYCVQIGDECVYEPGNPTFDEGETEKTVTVDDHYLTEHAPIIELRLKQAGVRLAHVLNQALGSTP